MTFNDAYLTLKSLGLWLLKSHRCKLPQIHSEGDDSIVILGNGPSLSATLQEHGKELRDRTTMGVNFFANTEAFRLIKPQYYILADPHFFKKGAGEPNVKALFSSLSSVDWPMIILIPFAAGKDLPIDGNEKIRIVRYNALRGEGAKWLTHRLYRSNRAMPRPRNVLIPAIMTSIGMGFKRIIIVGADHGWTATLSVNDANQVVSVQPHFYKDDTQELKRQRAEQMQRPLHELLESFAIAFKAYHQIADYAGVRGVEIINATPGSFIDAFPRSTSI